MFRRTFLGNLLLACVSCLAEGLKSIVHGRLTQAPGKTPALVTPQGSRVFLNGDEDALSVLNDPRLSGMELEAAGQFTAPDQFTLGPFYLNSLLVRKNGKRYEVTYWCDVCSIRTYTPGKCRCCQEETELDLREVTPEPQP